MDEPKEISEYCSCQDINFEKVIGTPYSEIYIRNVRVQPLGDGDLRLLLAEHPMHGSAWESLRQHGFHEDVTLLLDGEEYCYYCTVENDNKIYLFPSEDCNDSLPDNEKFLEKTVNIRLSW